MKKIITIIALFVVVHVKAQETSEKNQVSFQSINQLGFLTGETGNAFQIQTINGIKISRFFTGIGVGIDEYHTRSIPPLPGP